MFRYEADEGAEGVESMDGIGIGVGWVCLISMTFGFEESDNFLHTIRIRKE